MLNKLRDLGLLVKQHTNIRPGDITPLGLSRASQVFDSLRTPHSRQANAVPSPRRLAQLWCESLRRTDRMLELVAKREAPPFVHTHIQLQFVDRLLLELTNPPAAIYQELPMSDRIALTERGLELYDLQRSLSRNAEEFFRLEREKMRSQPKLGPALLKTLSPLCELTFRDAPWYSAADLYLHRFFRVPTTSGHPDEATHAVGFDYMPTPVSSMLQFYHQVKDSRSLKIADIGSGRGIQLFLLSVLLPSSTFTGIELNPTLVAESESLRNINAEYVPSEKVSFLKADALSRSYTEYDWLLLFTPFRPSSEGRFIELMDRLRHDSASRVRIAALGPTVQSLTRHPDIFQPIGNHSGDEEQYHFFALANAHSRAATPGTVAYSARG